MKLRRILTAASLFAMACGAASADSIAGTCGTAGPGGTELGPAGTTTTSGAISCTGFNTSLGTLTSITLTLSGAILNQSGDVSTITITNNNVTAQSGKGTTTSDFLLDPSSSLTGFTLPQVGANSALFETFATTGTQTVGASSTTVFHVSGSGTTGLLTDSNAATFAHYEGANFAFVYDTMTSITSTFTGGAVTVGQATFVTGNAAVTYNFTDAIPSSTPEPTTMVLFGSALVGLGLLRKRVRYQ
jgi:hypothetical protein